MMSCDDALLVDETMYGNLTSSAASGEISAASDSDPRIEIHTQEGFYSQSSLHSFASPDQPPLRPPKKKRSLPGNPDPDAEVIALSPGTLMAANRFMCEICNKGFQRDQNLQLHRRGHNLPWKLKQRGSKEVMIKKKVYVCPEPTCVHHDPSRALGDLTGVKKHFCRKHGDKKWKCDKCSKRYAVQSDLKAHSKICGTREYKCDCGTIFSRRDSFITHRAFCDALAENTPKPITNKSVPNLHLSYDYNNGQPSLPPTSNLETLSSKSEPDHFLNLPWTSPLSHIHNNSQGRQVISGSSSPILFDQESLPDNPNPSFTLPHHHHHHHFPNTALLLPPPSPFTLTTSSVPSSSSSSSPHIMSATALLQKAAQMGVTMSKLHHPNLSSSSLGSTPQPQDHHQHHHMRGILDTTGITRTSTTRTADNLQDIIRMKSTSTGARTGFDYEAGDVNGILMNNVEETTDFENEKQKICDFGGKYHASTTRDFLGLSGFSPKDLIDVGGFDFDTVIRKGQR